ncbi:ATP-binding protein [Actinocorallia lasiicapitis]
MTVIGTITLPGEDRAARAVRSFIRDTLPTRHPSLDDVQLCATELFTNALRHTRSGRGGQVTLTLTAASEQVTLAVTDDGTPCGSRPHPLPLSPTTESGRGLHLLQALSTSWGHHPADSRTTVWATFTRQSLPSK